MSRLYHIDTLGYMTNKTWSIEIIEEKLMYCTCYNMCAIVCVSLNKWCIPYTTRLLLKIKYTVRADATVDRTLAAGVRDGGARYYFVM